MNNNCKLSINTRNYLNAFYPILNEMIKEMTTAKLSDSISCNFIVQMIPHHRAAIKMSQNLLKYTTNIPLQNIAQNIITSQTKSIENMESVKCCCSRHLNPVAALSACQCRIDEILGTMFDAMGNSSVTNSIDENFIREMVPHHEGAIQMSKTTLQYSICPELVPILRSIITSQEEGVKQMQALLCQLTCPCAGR